MSSNKKPIAELRRELRHAQSEGLIEYVIDIRGIKTGKYGIVYEDPYISVRFLPSTSDKVKTKLMFHIHKTYEHIKSVKIGKTGDCIEIFYDESQID
jgi:hypothetical protein